MPRVWLGLAMLAVVLGTGLAHALADQASPSVGEPLAAPSLAPEASIWTTPLSRVNFSRLSDARQRLGQLLGLAQPHLDGVTVDPAGGAAVVAIAILPRLVAERDHGVRAPPWCGRANGTTLLGT